MKKLLGILAAMTMVIGVQAEGEVGPFGVGLKGIMAPNGGIMPVATFRFAPAPIGGEIQIGQYSFDQDGGQNGNALSLAGQLLYSFIQRENSRFYAGAALGVDYAEIENADGSKDTDESIINFGGLVGAEWWMSERPELGINFDVGYYFSSLDDSSTVTPEDETRSGIVVSLGATYYF